jgi:predicted transcriptional regulator
MNTSNINKISEKLQTLRDADLPELIEFINYLNAKDSTDDFVLSKQQISLLDKRSKTPIEECIPAEQVIANLKNKYDI